VIVLLNGAFGIGKTTVARALVARLPDSLLFDPELTGLILQRTLRAAGRDVGDFQDLTSWRRLTILGLRLARRVKTNIVVPMAFSNASYLREVRDGISRADPHVVHFCLVAPLAVVQARIRARGVDPADPDGAWQYRRATECCAIHSDTAFAEQVSAVGRGPDAIAEELLTRLTAAPSLRIS